MKKYCSIVALAVLLMLPVQAFAENDENALSKYDGFILPLISDWKYHASQTQPDEGWIDADFDDSGWKQGKAGFGYGDGDDTTIFDDMKGSYDTVRIRNRFTLTSVPKKLYLYMLYDDAFILYLNGKKVMSVGRRGTDHEARAMEIFTLKSKFLVNGENVIAIQGINSSLNSSDFSLWPAIAATKNALDPTPAS